MSFRHSHDTQDTVTTTYCTNVFISVQTVHLMIVTHETMVTKQKYTSLLCFYFL